MGNITLREMQISDYDEVIQLLENIEGIVIREVDSYYATKAYLERNPQLSFVACSDGNIVGCIMTGHDGRRGYLQHLAINPDYRRKGIARKLVNRIISELELISINKSHIFILKENANAKVFWEKLGWKKREDINMYSFISVFNSNS